jgi:hypothetical protein
MEAAQKHKQLEEIRVCAEVAIRCIHSEPVSRPGMLEIIEILNDTESMECSIETGMSTSPVTTHVSLLMTQIETSSC